jgi:hypothetical protein
MGWTDDSDYSGDGSDLFTDSEDAPPITSTTTFYAVYADATTSGSGSVNTTVSMSSFTSVSGNVDGDSNVSYAAAQGDAGTAPVVNSSQIRIYQNGGLLTITANNGKKLTSITIGSAMTTTVTYAVDEGSASSNQSITAGNTFTLNSINATSVVFTCTGTDKNSRLYLNNLSVTYSGSGSVTTYSNYSTQCTASSCTLSNITLNTSSVQKSFSVGDAFNYTGLVVTANYSDCASKTVSPTSVSSPDMSTTGNKTVTVSYTESGTTKTATYTITVEAATVYTVNWHVNGTTTPVVYTSGNALVLPSTPEDCDDDRVFMGWTSTANYSGDAAPGNMFTTASGTVTANADYYAVYADKSGSGSSTVYVVDTMTYAETGATPGSSAVYSTWSNVSLRSDAIYAGNTSAGTTGSPYIQLRSNNSNSGIITTASGGVLDKITVVWNSTTQADRTVNVYGKTSAYSAATDLYNSGTRGTSLGTIVKGTSTELDLSGSSDEYTYFGFRSNSGALYIDTVFVRWKNTTSGSLTYSGYSTVCSDAPTNYTITVNAGAGGSVAGGGSYAEGSTPSITATPNSCYEFVEWNDHNTSNPRTITVTGDATYTASFQQINYTVTATSNDENMGTVGVTLP